MISIGQWRKTLDTDGFDGFPPVVHHSDEMEQFQSLRKSVAKKGEVKLKMHVHVFRDYTRFQQSSL